MCQIEILMVFTLVFHIIWQSFVRWTVFELTEEV